MSAPLPMWDRQQLRAQSLCHLYSLKPKTSMIWSSMQSAQNIYTMQCTTWSHLLHPRHSMCSHNLKLNTHLAKARFSKIHSNGQTLGSETRFESDLILIAASCHEPDFGLGVYISEDMTTPTHCQICSEYSPHFFQKNRGSIRLIFWATTTGQTGKRNLLLLLLHN